MAQLGKQRFLKSLGICFLSLWPFNPEHTSFSPSTKVWIWSPRQILLCHLQLWIGCVHQSCAAVTSLREELMGLSSLGAGDFILSGLITFKIFHKPSYEWAVVTKTVHKLKFLQLSKFNDRSPTSSYWKSSKAHDHVVITLPVPNKKCQMNSSPRSVPAV